MKKSKLTFKVPSRYKVGSSPTENIRRRMVEAMNVLIPDGRGNVMTMASDINMAAHTSPDKRGSSSEQQARNK